MKKLLVGLCAVFICTIAIAHSIEWYVDNTLYQTTTCNSGDNITPPTAPEKYGYTFDRWDGYKSLEYIESTGTQYIDTGIKGNNNLRVVFNLEFVSGGEQWVLGVKRGNERVYVYQISNTRTGYIGYGTFLATGFEENYGVKKEYEVVLNKGQQELYVNGVLKYNNAIDSNITTNANMTLFALDADGNMQGYAYAKLYSMSIWQNNTMVRNFIPAKRNSNNAVGMYDTVSQTFFTNAGTGEFIAGPEVGGL